MKKHSLVLLIVGVLALPFSAAAQSQADEEFVLELPEGFSEFQRTEQTVPTPSGPITQVTYLSKSDQGAFIVTYSDVNDQITDPGAMMESGRDSLLKSINASLEDEQEISLDGQPGMSFRYKADQPRPVYARTDLVVVGPRMYQVIFLGFTEEARDRADVASSFSSFRVPKSLIPGETEPVQTGDRAASESATLR